MYKIISKVIHGQGKGHNLGFPTANQDISSLEKLPPLGVYASKVYVDYVEYLGVSNVGLRPTIDNKEDISIETNILDFDGDLYDKVIEVQLIYYIREIKKFDNVNELLKQINKDKEKTRELFK